VYGVPGRAIGSVELDRQKLKVLATSGVEDEVTAKFGKLDGASTGVKLTVAVIGFAVADPVPTRYTGTV
jgi:hypothetical protein